MNESNFLHFLILKLIYNIRYRSDDYFTVLQKCFPNTCQNGRCEMADPKTPIERVTCLCNHLWKGYKCSESKLRWK